jgi:hypothetical protein
MSDDLKAKLLDFFAHLTVKRIGISALALSVILSFYTVYENRQNIFEKAKAVTMGSDFKVSPPNVEQHAIVMRFMAIHPEIAFMTLIDADPVANRRTVIHRFFNDGSLESYFAKVDKERPGSGDGPLFSDNEQNNAQVLAIANGEFLCSETKGGILEKQFPSVAKDIMKSCRVPLPPAFRKSGGWFAMHLKADKDMAALKTDALTMSFLFFEASK